jgi:hypothetical protein
MIDLLFQIALSNVGISLALAIVAAANERRGAVGPIAHPSPWTKVLFDLLPGWDRRGRGGS